MRENLYDLHEESEKLWKFQDILETLLCLQFFYFLFLPTTLAHCDINLMVIYICGSNFLFYVKLLNGPVLILCDDSKSFTNHHLPLEQSHLLFAVVKHWDQTLK